MQPLARGAPIRPQQTPVSKPIRTQYDSLGKRPIDRRVGCNFWMFEKGFAAGKLGRDLSPAQGLATIAERLGDVDACDLLLAVEIGKRAGVAKGPVIAAGR